MVHSGCIKTANMFPSGGGLTCNTHFLNIMANFSVSHYLARRQCSIDVILMDDGEAQQNSKKHWLVKKFVTKRVLLEGF